MPLTTKILREETSALTSLVASQQMEAMLEALREVASRVVPHVVETEHPLLCSSETLASSLMSRVSVDISRSVVPLRLSELPWEMMAELRALLMLNLRLPKQPRRLLS